MSEAPEDPFAALRGQRELLPRGGAPGARPGPPAAAADDAPPLLEPQPGPLAWPTVRRGLVRGGFVVLVTLALLAYTASQLGQWLGWEYWLSCGVQLVASVAMIAALAVLERWMALRADPLGGREWALVGLALFAARVAADASMTYLATVTQTRSIVEAMTSVARALVLEPSAWDYLRCVVGAAPWLALVWLRLRGAPVGRQLGAVIAVYLAGGAISHAVLVGSAWVGFGAAISYFLGGAGLVLALHFGDVVADRRWGCVPVARAEVQALRARSQEGQRA